MANADGGPAFPQGDDRIGHEGMSLRDWFAGQALAGCLAYSYYNVTWGDYHNNGTDDSLANKVYSIADAMLRNRAENG